MYNIDQCAPCVSFVYFLHLLTSYLMKTALVFHLQQVNCAIVCLSVESFEGELPLSPKVPSKRDNSFHFFFGALPSVPLPLCSFQKFLLRLVTQKERVGGSEGDPSWGGGAEQERMVWENTWTDFSKIFAAISKDLRIFRYIKKIQFSPKPFLVFRADS